MKKFESIRKSRDGVRTMTTRKILIAAIATILAISLNSFATAQLPQDVRDVFEGMLDDLDKDLQAKFQAAIKNDTATVEFTPDEFTRFRSNPVNPFEGLDEIAIDGSNIALQFELPSMRNRMLHQFERQSENVLASLKEQVASASASTVRVFSNDRQVAMGTVVGKDGYVLTKASEVENRDSINCMLHDGRKFDASIVRTDSDNDLAVLKIEISGLPVVQWSEKQVISGAFVLTPDHNATVISMGTYSVPPRSTAEGKQAFLGVQPETTTVGVRVSDIRPGSASFKAGLKNGDVITRLGGTHIPDVASLVRTIRDRVPGDKVEIEYVRNGSQARTSAILAARDYSGEQAARFKMMNRLGAVPSGRADNFPSVFQHDSPLFPEQCGGPITDLEGNVLGINIARQGRAASYAIPASHLKTLMADLLRENVASR